MRVLILSQYFWPESFSINQLAATLREQGAEVEILTAKPNYPDGKIYPGYSAWGCQRDSFQEMPIHRIPLFPRGTGGFRLALNYISFVVAGLVFGPWMLRGTRFDAIFVYAPSPILQAIPAILLGLIKKCPVVLWVQDLWPDSLSATGYIRSPLILAAIRELVRWIYRQVDLILVQSEAFREPVAELAGDVSKIAFFPNGVEAKLLENPIPSAAVECLAAAMGGCFSVLFAGNLGSAQALDTILDAAAILRDEASIRLFLVGTGNQFDLLKARIRDENLSNVEMPGRFSREDMTLLFKNASVLLASLRDDQVFDRTIPSKIQSYMMAGKPIIASLNGEGARIIQLAGAGLSCPAEDPQALAETIRKLSTLPDHVRLAYGQSARQYAVENFSLDLLAVRFSRLLSNLLTTAKSDP